MNDLLPLALWRPLVDDLLPRVCWPTFWWILCRAWSLGLHWLMLCRRCCWMLILWVDALPSWLCLLCSKPLRCCIFFLAGSFGSGGRCHSQFFLDFVFILGHSLTNTFMVSDLCYEDSLVAVSFTLLNENELYSSTAKKSYLMTLFSPRNKKNRPFSFSPSHSP